MIITFLIFTGLQEVEAKINAPTLNEVMRPQDLLCWKADINGKSFDVTINRDNKTVTVKGCVSDQYEMDLVKRHFEMRAPTTYKIIHQLEFAEEITHDHEIDFAD
jgi:hypothetical protein